MHNWEHYSRLPAYLLAATLVASCGGGGDSGLSTNGQSVATIQATTTNVLMGLGSTSSFKVRLLDGQTPIIGQNVQAQIVVGADAASLVTTSAITDKDGYAVFEIKSAGSAAKGMLSISYLDAKGNKSFKELELEIKDGANTPSSFALQAAEPGAVTISTTGTTKKDIVVVLRDATGATVDGATVNFSLPTSATNRGRLLNATAITKDGGKATVTIDGLNQTTGENLLIASYTDAIKSKVSTEINFKIINKFDVILDASTLSLKTGGSSTVLTARVTNASQAIVKNAKVAFKVLNKEPKGNLEGCPQDVTDSNKFEAKEILKRKVGTLLVTDALTNDNGVATTTFSVNDNSNGKRRVLVTVSDEFSEQAVDCLDLSLTGTVLSLDKTDINTTPTQEPQITATIKNGLGAGVQDVVIDFKEGNTSIFTDKTKADGTVKLQKKFATNTTLNVSSVDFNADPPPNLSITVSDAGFNVAYVNAEDNSILKGNINEKITVKVSAPTKLRLLSTLILGADVTANGDNTFTIKSSIPGLARLDFVDDNGVVKGSSEFRFVSPIPAKMTLQANVSTLRPNEQAVIEAKLLDVNDNPVQDVLVEFYRQDPSNGTLSTAVAKTDENGKASVTFTAGTLATAKDAVKIFAKAKKADNSDIEPIPVKLTVGGEALFITIATGKTISFLNETTYAMPLSIAVADAVGQPARDSQVSVQVVPTRYLRGVYYFNTEAESWVTAAADPTIVANGIGKNTNSISTDLSPVACFSEDGNTNGILDDGEDKNMDRILTPANPVTVSGRLVTDENGRVSFNIQYGKSFANWLEVKLIASTSVAGSEFKAERTFVLPVLDADVLNKKSSPPGGPLSPYGNLPVIYIQDPVDESISNFVTTAVVTDTGGNFKALSTLLNTTPVNTRIDPCGTTDIKVKEMENGVEVEKEVKTKTDGFNRYFYKRDTN